MKTDKIIHKTGKVESEVILDELGNVIEGRTFKFYGSYFKTVEKMSNVNEKKRLQKNIPYCFDHEKKMIALANKKGLPAVELVCERPDYVLEIKYIASDSLQKLLESPDTTKIKRRYLATEAVRCLYKHHEGKIFVIDSHPANYLVLPTGETIFCDYGNAYSPVDMPFKVPPLAAGNTKENIYFSEAQHKAFCADRVWDRANLAAPYEADVLASNNLGAVDDFWLFAHHVLQIKVKICDAEGNLLGKVPTDQLFDPDLITILHDMKRGKYASGKEILQKLSETAPDELKNKWTPEIEIETEPDEPKMFRDPKSVKPNKTLKFSLPNWKFNLLAPGKQILRGVGAPVVTTVICIAFGLGIGGNYEGYRQKTTDGSKVLATVLQNANTDTSLIVPPQEVTIANTPTPDPSAKAAIQVTVNEPVKVAEQPAASVVIAAKQITPQQKAINKASEQLNKPVSSPEYRIALKRLAKLKTPEAIVILETHMTQAKSDAASEQFSQANNGIRVLHLIAGVKSQVSQKAFAAIGDVIQQTIQDGPSEKNRQKLELLAGFGNVKAHHELARWLENGKGFKERDLAAAYGHYVAARYKVPEAAKAVARIELSAPDMVKTPSTCKEGFRLLLAIAERPRNKETQYAVGRIYAQGLYGQLTDKKLAKEYLTRSARNGFTEADAALKYFKLQG